MKAIASTFFFLFYCSVAIAQNPLVKMWDKRFGGTGSDQLGSFQQTNDGGYVLGGYSHSDSSGDFSLSSRGVWDYWLIRVDSNGNKLWDKRYGGNSADYLFSLQPTTDSGYILGGWSISPVSGDKTEANRGQFDYWIIKTDGLGNKLWDKTFGGTNQEELYAVQQTTDGGYILGGYSDSDSTGDVSQHTKGSLDYWIVKTDAAGNKLWDKRYGGAQEDWCSSLLQTTDGGFMLGGFSRSPVSGDKTQPCQGLFDYWLVKIDSAGNKQWDKTFGGNADDYMSSLRQSFDAGYLLAGNSYSGISGDKTEASRGSADFWVVKTDSLGNKLWDKRYGGTNTEEMVSLVQTVDSGFLIAGDSYSPTSGDKSEANLGLEQTWAVKANAYGIKQWDKTISTTGHDETSMAIQTHDGCFLFANSTDAGIGGYKTQPSQGSYDFWSIKFCDSAHIPQCNLASPNIAANQSQFCASDSTLICAATIYTNYLWNNGSPNQCITTNLAGNYYVTVTDANGCTAESNHLAITVYPLPPVAISVNGDTLSVYGAVSQQWYLNGSAINGATAPLYIANQSGSYTVAVTDTNGCVATSSAVIISGVDNLSEEDVVSVYQLTVGSWQLTVGNNWLGGTAEVFDANGRIVFQSLITSHQSLITLDVSRGVYLLRISSSKSSVVRKLVRL